MKKLLHISYDLRDRFNRETTTAVINLINQSKKNFEVNVIDVVRYPNFNKEKIELKDDDYLELNVFGLPRGLFLLAHLKRVYSKYKEAEKSYNLSFGKVDGVHCHKLTFEGYIGYKIAKENDAHLFITLRQTDFSVLKYKPLLVPVYKRILKYSSIIFYLLPCMIQKLEEIVGSEFFNSYVRNKLVFLPNIIEREVIHKNENNEKYFLTIARMTKKSIKRKNIINLLKAFARFDRNDVKLKIAGDGENLFQIKKWIKQFNLKDRVELLGAIPNVKIDKYYSRCIAYVMPSYSESFGMVYAESLLNGAPIMFSKGVLGFEGVFDEAGVGVYPDSVESILQGLNELYDRNIQLRKNIDELKSKNAFNIFTSEYIKDLYSTELNKRLIIGKDEKISYSSKY